MLAGGRSASGTAGLELQRCPASLKHPTVVAVAATLHACAAEAVGIHAVAAGGGANQAVAAIATAIHAGAEAAFAHHAAGVGGHAVDAVAVVDRISDGEYGLGAGAVRVTSEERLSTRVARDVVPTNVDAVAVWHLRSLLFSRLFCWLDCRLLTSGTMPCQLRASPQACKSPAWPPFSSFLNSPPE